MSETSLRNTLIAIAFASLAVPQDAAAATLRLVGAAPKAPKVSKKQLEQLKTIERHEWMAQYYLRRGNDLAGAAKEYKAILAADPKNVSASLALASIYLADKKEKQALEVATRLTKQNPKDAQGWLLLAELDARAGNDAGLKAAAGKVLELQPGNVSAWSMLFANAQKRLRAGDTTAKAEALEAARKLVQLSRATGGPLYGFAERAVVELGGDALALTIYDARQAYAGAFQNPSMGRINEQMAKARRGFEECTQKAPDNQDCHYYLGLVYSSVKASEAYDPKKALAELALAPSLPLAWVESARLLRAGDKDAEARAALEKALALDPRLAVAHVELGILDKGAGQTADAVAHFVAAMDIDRYGADGDRALIELTKVDPTHPRVAHAMMSGKRGDIFSSDRYKTAITMLESELGGIETGAPETAVLEEIVRKLSEASALRQQFRVQLVGTHMVNAFAVADGRVYVTRGLVEMMKKRDPKGKLDANNDMLGHILGHELAHVLRRHTMNTAMFQEAINDESRAFDPSVITHVTRLHEIEADRDGMVMAFLAGYHPRGGIEFMEAMGQEMEVPKHLDHPTYQERADYLTEYWTNDVRYAFVSFKLGVAALDRGGELEATDMRLAILAYEDAADDFKRFRAMLPSLKEGMNDLGVAYTKLGVLAMTAADSPLCRWQTRFSLERESAVKYVGLARNDETGRTRGTKDQARLPWQLREAISSFKEALAADEGYGKARLNLAAAYLAANQVDNAAATLAKVEAGRGVDAGDVELVRGVALAEKKDYDKARDSFVRALASPAARGAASFNFARTLELAGKKEDAKRAYLQYASQFPGGPWAKAATIAAGKL
jgi:predicted Zn-dependent protease